MNTSSPNSPESDAPCEQGNTGLQSPRPRVLFAYLTLAIALVGSATYFASHLHAADEAPAAAAPAAPPAPKVTVAAVEEITVVDHRELLGRVEAVESVEVRPRVSGHIAEVRLQAGQPVKKGDVLFVIDPRWYQAAYNLATAQSERAKVRVRIAERDARRAEELLKSRAISLEESDTRTALLDEARAELQAAEAGLATAKLDLEHTEVRAPIDGRISRAYVTAGNLVSGSPGGATLLTSIISSGEVYVYADIDEATLLAFNRLSHQGLLPDDKGRVPVTMQLSDEKGFPHRGHIESSDNRLDPGTGSLVLRMVFPNPDGSLVPGLSARVNVPVSAPQPTLFVNERAIGTNQSQKFVFTVAADNKAAYRAIKLGPVRDGKRIVRDGLQSGDRVIVNGLQRVAAGMVVSPETGSVAMK